MATITGIDIQGMVRHWLNTPEGAYLGSSYGSNIKELLQNPQAIGRADAVILKMKTDIPILQSLPSGSINIYSITSSADKLELVIDVAGQIVQVPTIQTSNRRPDLVIPDTVAPTLTITSTLSELEVGGVAIVAFTFSEAVGATFEHGDILVTNGTLGPLSWDGLIATAEFTANSPGIAEISVADGSYFDLATPPNPGHGGSLNITINSLPLPVQDMTFSSEFAEAKITELGKVVQFGPGDFPAWYHAKSSETVTASSSRHFEVEVEAFDFSTTRELAIGIAVSGTSGGNAGSNGRYQYFGSGERRADGIYEAYGAEYAAGDLIGCSVGDAGGFVEIHFYKNGVDQGAWLTTLPSSQVIEAHFSIYQNSSSFIKRLRFPIELQHLPEGFAPWA